MNWWGKLIGGAAGFAMGGPLGALIGTALGHAVDRHGAGLQSEQPHGAHDGPMPDHTAITQTFFFTATFAVMGHMAKADGQVSHDEIQMAERVMDRLALDRARRHFAQALFRQGKHADFPLPDVLHQLRRETRSRNLLRVFLEIQVFAAYADGRLHPHERALLEQIRNALGFDAATLAQVEQLVAAELGMQAGTARARTTRLADDYALLGITPSADAKSVKRAYRRMMSQHHPDRLVAKGLPEEMIKLATAKTQAIKAAYERIRDSSA